MKHIVSSIVYLAALLSLSEFVFDPTHLYYELPWLDIPMHVFGGFGVVSLVFSIAHYKKQKISLVMALTLYLCVAVGWELYELVHDILRHSEWNGWVDTTSDIINGGIGGTVAYFILKK